MKRISVLVLLAGVLLLVAGILLAQTGDDPPAKPADNPPPVVQDSSDSPDLSEPLTVAQANLDETNPLASNCLDCHTDAVRLQELAEEEEVVESLSEGSG